MCDKPSDSAMPISKRTQGIYHRSSPAVSSNLPTLLVQPDGSTITIRYKEPRRIVKVK
jgi:hypothetical protein